MTDAGLSLTRQPPIDPDASVILDDRALADVLDDRHSPEWTLRVVDAARALGRDRTWTDLADVLEADEIDTADGRLRALILRLARGDARAVHQLHALLGTVATGRSPVEDAHAVPRLFARDDVDVATPTIAVRVTGEFFERRRSQREDVCRWLAALAGGCDVRLVGTGLRLRELYHEHRTDLPVSRDDIAPTRERGPVADVVEDALDALDADGRPVRILRLLAGEETQTLPYAAVRAEFTVSRSRVSQCLSTLRDAGLIATFDGTGRTRFVELLEPGELVLDRLDAEIGRQTELGECVSESGTSSLQAVYSRDRQEPPQTAGDAAADAPGPHRTAYLARDRHSAAVASAVEGGISTVSHPVDGEDARVHGVSVDEDDDAVVVEWTANSALRSVVSPAVALASPKVVNAVLADDRLADLEEPPAILRDARCIGALPDDALDDALAGDGEDLRDGFLSWGEDVAEMTTSLKRGDYEDRNRFRGDIMRTAHGLYGSLVALLDALGVDVVRVLRLPSGQNTNRLREIASTTAKAAMIQSAYGVHAAYRQLLDPRDEKRDAALGVDVDAADPYGRLLGSLVVVGSDVHRFDPVLRRRLDVGDQDVVEDAPEFAVRFPFVDRTNDRRAYADVARAVLGLKDLRMTRAAVDVLHAFAGTPFDAARALHRSLAVENDHAGRRVRVDELRRALAVLPAERLVPEETPTVQAVLSTLLATDAALRPGDLAERAGVTARSLRKHRARLEALDVLRETGDGRLRFALSRPDDAGERGRDAVLPWWLDAPDRDGADGVEETLGELVFDVLLESRDVPDGRLLDFDDPLGASLVWPVDYDETVAEVPWLAAWLPALRVAASNTPEDADSPLSGAEEPGFEDATPGVDVAMMGSNPQQTALP